MSALIASDLPGLTLVSKGKVRDIYATSSPDHLLFVASDRISAYDVILNNVRSPGSFPRAKYNSFAHRAITRVCRASRTRANC